MVASVFHAVQSSVASSQDLDSDLAHGLLPCSTRYLIPNRLPLVEESGPGTERCFSETRPPGAGSNKDTTSDQGLDASAGLRSAPRSFHSVGVPQIPQGGNWGGWQNTLSGEG
jgi:hypothetical protein